MKVRVIVSWALPAVMVMLAASLASGEMVTRRYGKAPAGPPAAVKAAKGLAKPPVAYVPETAGPPTIDGKLDDAAWAKAAVLSLTKTLDGAANAPQPTEVRLLRDAKNLYVAVKCAEPMMSKLVAQVAGHDGNAYRDDSIEFFIGSADEYYHFAVAAGGGDFDAKGKSGAEWNSGFKSAVAKGQAEWTAELAIPLEKISPEGKATELIANFNRNRRAAGRLQESAWSPTGSDDSHVPSRFGKLVFGNPPAAVAEAHAGELPVAASNTKGGVSIVPVSNGEGLAVFDLSDLPKGAKVYRADLLVFRTSVLTGADDNAMIDIEVFPLNEAAASGGQVKPSGKPLALRGPMFDRFDATAAVADWAAGTSNGGFFFKTCPRWLADGTCLEIAFEGKAENVPAQVNAVKAVHRAGQTFITWREVEPLITDEKTTYGAIRSALAEGGKSACRYRIYVSDKPIDAGSIGQAAFVAEIEPLSAYNVNGRCQEYLYGEAMVKSDQMGELAENFNGRMFQWGMNSPRMDRYPVGRFVIDAKGAQLPVGSGLYVHTPSAAGTRYYAVLSCKDGVENAKDISPLNIFGPVEEVVGSGEPVRQGDGLWGPYFDYPGKRHNYVQWCGPPLTPRQNMYFNWSVLLPPDVATSRPVELYFHTSEHSYAKPSSKMFLDSIQLAPHDWPPSGWYGYNDAMGTLKSFKAGVVGNHTQRRIIAFLEWAKKAFPIDADRVIASGGDGAALLALNYPDMFSYLLITRFEAATLSPKAAGAFEVVWGKKSPDIKDDQGRSEWAWSDLDQLVLAHAERDLPMFHCGSASWGCVGGYGRGEGRFYDAMRKTGQPVSGGWSWSYSLARPNRFDDKWRGLDIRRTTPIPAFANSSADVDGEVNGHTNMQYSWRDVSDTAGQFKVTIAGPESTFDLTPQQCQAFKLKGGEKLTWKAAPSAAGAAKPGTTQPAEQSGTAEADKNGIVTVKGIKCPNGSVTLVVERAK